MHSMVVALALLWSCTAQAQEYVINAFGASGRYNLFTASADGWINNFTPLPHPPNSVHTAWPSGIARNGITTVYATVYLSRWDVVGRWTRTGSQWTYHGAVLSASSVEPHGIGPTWVGYDDGSMQFLMYYVENGASGVGVAIHLATSPDGIVWTRQGRVIIPGAPNTVGGLTVSYACRDDDGRYLVTYHGYDATLNKGVALIATSSTPSGPFSTAPTLMLGDNWESTAWGRAGNAVISMPSGVSPPFGVPLLLPNGEIAVAKKQTGSTVFLFWPLRNDITWAPIVSAAKNKVDPSYIRRTASGWDGTWTVYGGIANRTAEYTIKVSAPSATGPWTLARTGVVIKPFFAEGQQSAENPQPIASDMSCRG